MKTSMEYAVARLKREAPELYAQVEAGDLSVHAAMVSAGFRHERFTVFVTSAVPIAHTLRSKLSDSMLAEVARLIA